MSASTGASNPPRIEPAWYGLNEDEVPHVEQVEYLTDDCASYSFDDFMVVRDKRDGRLYWAQDSGCSCPSPFEHCHKVADLNPLVRQTKDEFLKALDDYMAQGYGCFQHEANLQARDRLRKLVEGLS